MKTLVKVCLLFSPLTVLACASEVEMPEVDIEAARAELLETDLAWAAAASAGEDLELIISFWSDDATVIPPSEAAVRGKDAIREFVGASLETPGFHVTWEPAEVQIGPSGLVGFTTGTNQFTVPDEAGGMMTVEGRYVTIWMKGEDGAWKCALDIWNNAPPPAEG